MKFILPHKTLPSSVRLFVFITLTSRVLLWREAVGLEAWGGFKLKVIYDKYHIQCG